MNFANDYLKELYATRKVNLHKLIEGLGTQRAVADHVGVSQEYISRLATGKETFTEKYARRIEEKFHMRFGTLDREV